MRIVKTTHWYFWSVLKDKIANVKWSHQSNQMKSQTKLALPHILHKIFAKNIREYLWQTKKGRKENNKRILKM